VKDKLEMMAQVSRLEQRSTKFDQSRFVKATKLKCRVWNASGVKNKVVSEVLKECGVCEVRWCLLHYHAKAQLHKFWSRYFLCIHQAQNRNTSKI